MNLMICFIKANEASALKVNTSFLMKVRLSEIKRNNYLSN